MKHIRSIVATLAIVTAILAFPAGNASAASNSLGVNPRRDYTIKSGEKINDTLFVTNLSKTDDLVVDIQLIDFSAKDETGSPTLLLGQKEPARWSLKPYMTIAKNYTIAAGKSAEVPFTISIPANVGAGSYYSAVKYSTSGQESEDNVSLTSSSATLMFIRVPGEAKDILKLKDFGAFTPDASGNSGTYGSLYAGSAPKYLSYRLTNEGNVAEQPTGSVQIKDMFGKQVKLFENANPGNNIVLIDQTRRINLCINEDKINRKDAESGRNVEEVKCNNSGLSPGRYTAQLAIIYGDNGSSSHELRDVASFWYLPIWFVILSIAVLAAVAGLIWYGIRKFTRRGRPGFSSRR